MKTLLSVLLLASVAYGQGKTAPQQGPPPKILTQKADGHFTANGDPANPEKFEIYTVKAGDTLSVIAGQVLKNPGLWPQLWEQNDHIVNPHWIYPNDKILIKPVTTITEAVPPPPPAPAPATELAPPPPPQQPVATVTPLPTPPAPKPPLVFDLKKAKPVSEIKPTDLYCSGFVRKAAVPKDVKIIAKYDASSGALASQGDYIYIGKGAEDGVKTGSMFQVIRPTVQIQGFNGQLKADRNLGMHYLDIGQIQVVTTQADFSMARVVTSCEALEIGDIMVPFEKLTVPVLMQGRPFSPFMTTSGDLKGSVLVSKTVLMNFGSAFQASGAIPGAETPSMAGIQKGIAGTGDVVYVDLGQRSGVKAGDTFIVYRQMEDDGQLYGNSSETKKLAKLKTAIGELVILKVDDGVSSALVTYTSVGISAGDSVERR